jgi:CRP-like cAMP-binding protein
MAAEIKRLRTKADRLRQQDAQQLRQMVLAYAATCRVPDRAVGEIIAVIDRETASRSGWAFVMVNPQINAAVVDWLIRNSTRPMVGVRLWASLFPHIRDDTCEIVQTRAELAATLGVLPRHVSEIMTELESIGAISRKRMPHGVAYFMNPRVGTHLTGMLRDKLQDIAVPLNFAPPAPRPKRARKAPHLSVVPPAE